MKLCKDCKNRGKKRTCQLYGIISNYAEVCKDFVEVKQTNAERIRSMSDEELAEYIPILFDLCCNPTEECMKNTFVCGECTKTKVCVLHWLQSEVEE